MKKDKQQDLIKLEVGNRLRQLRNKSGYNQGQLASGVGLTRTSIVNIELGRQSLTVETLLKICAVLKCKYSEVLPPPPKAVIKELNKVMKVKEITYKTLGVDFKW